jgi:Ni,Fe-hydrogenase III large subunit
VISAAELAEIADVTCKTIQRVETVGGIPHNRSGTLDKVGTALEAKGIDFSWRSGEEPRS